MHFETLDSRKLFAAGLDPTFGKDGMIPFTASFQPGYSLAQYYDNHIVESGDNGSVFVAGSVGETHYVAKYDKNGRLITKFGDGGYAQVPNEAARLTYNAANGLLFVASDTELTGQGYSAQLNVSRLRPSGEFDRAFGTDGVFTYSLAIPPSTNANFPNAYATVRVQRMNVLADGSSVLAVERITQPQAVAADHSLALIKLRPDGTRDAKFGGRGVAQVIGGYIGIDFAQQPSENGLAEVGTFTDVRTNKNGATTVTFKYARGTSPYLDSTRPDTQPTNGFFYVWSKTFSGKGVTDDAKTYTWKLVGKHAAGDSYSYGITYAAPADKNGVFYAVLNDYGRVGEAATQYLYTLKPGKAAYKESFTPAGLTDVSSMSRSANGRYVATDDQKHVVRLNADFTPDRTFADRGVGTGYGGFGSYRAGAPYIDPAGRVLAFEFDKKFRFVLERFD